MTRAQRWTLFGAPLAIFLALAALTVAVGAPLVRAQGTGDAPHPAHIHSGTCAELGDIVAALNDVTDITGGESFGSRSAIPVELSVKEVELSLGDILAAPHAINIHESADAIQNYIACGDIGGRVVDNTLVIGLQELNGSGHSGIAVLEADDDDETDVVVYLAEGGASSGTGQVAAPAAATDTPAAPAEATAAPAVQEIPVDIREFEFIPPSVEIAVGDTVTWTNQGNVPHTATAEQRDVLQSGAIAPGSSFSQVFDEAGEFAYFCEFHPNMTGTIVVQ